MKSVAKKVLATAFLILALAAVYLYRAPLSGIAREYLKLLWPPAPCTEPIKYDLGSFDDRFGITEKQFLQAISKAADIWGSAIDRKLFQYSSTSPDMAISLVYDYRQQATDELHRIGLTIDNNRAGYDMLKAKYDSLYASYVSQKSSIQASLDAYSIAKKSYEEQVAYWNTRGGAPKEEYDKLRNQLSAMNSQGAALNKQQALFNELVKTVNSAATALNQLGRELNLDVKNYNTVGASAGEEFSEAEYVEDRSGRRINVYQFNNQSQLTRVLEHELGHALGLGHVNDTKAIMYRLNQAANEQLTADDISELDKACGLQ